MDFVVGLPRSHQGNIGVWVIIDCLTKLAHLLPIKVSYNLNKLAELYVKEIIKSHGAPVSIISDCDPRFTLRFWPSLQEALATELRFSTTFHPQTNGQSECTIQILEDILRSSTLDFGDNWDKQVPLMEFTYNNSHQSSIDMAPFEALYVRKYRTPIFW